MPDNIKFFSHSKISQLRGNIKDNLSIYTDTTATFMDSMAEGDIKTAEKAIINSDLAKSIQMPNGDNLGDAHNSILVYESIPIAPMHACDERIWVYLSHFDLCDYIGKRWPMPPDDDKKKERHIRSHYFVTGSRGLLRDNGVARLWWMGYIASRCTKLDNPREALDILFLQSDVRANFLERNLSMNPDIFDAVVSLLKKDYEIAKECVGKGATKEQKEKLKKSLFGRERFRNLMKSLNRVGGYRMLDVIDYQNLYSEIETLSKISP